MRPGDIFLLFCALTAAAGASPQPTIIDYPLPTAASTATWIVKGQDGNLWFTEYATVAEAQVRHLFAVDRSVQPAPGDLLFADQRVSLIDS